MESKLNSLGIKDSDANDQQPQLQSLGSEGRSGRAIPNTFPPPSRHENKFISVGQHLQPRLSPQNQQRRSIFRASNIMNQTEGDQFNLDPSLFQRQTSHQIPAIIQQRQRAALASHQNKSQQHQQQQHGINPHHHSSFAESTNPSVQLRMTETEPLKFNSGNVLMEAFEIAQRSNLTMNEHSNPRDTASSPNWVNPIPNPTELLASPQNTRLLQSPMSTPQPMLKEIQHFWTLWHVHPSQNGSGKPAVVNTTEQLEQDFQTNGNNLLKDLSGIPYNYRGRLLQDGESYYYLKQKWYMNYVAPANIKEFASGKLVCFKKPIPPNTFFSPSGENSFFGNKWEKMLKILMLAIDDEDQPSFSEIIVGAVVRKQISPHSESHQEISILVKNLSEEMRQIFSEYIYIKLYHAFWSEPETANPFLSQSSFEYEEDNF